MPHKVETTEVKRVNNNMHQAPPTPPPTASRNDKKKETGGHMLLLWAQETLGQNLTINERLYQQGMESSNDNKPGA